MIRLFGVKIYDDFDYRMMMKMKLHKHTLIKYIIYIETNNKNITLLTK